MTCERCGRDAPCEKVSLHQHVGLIVLFAHSRHAGRFCRICIGELFRRTTLVTALSGWWGILSVLVTPVVLTWNVVSFLRAKRTPRPAPEQKPPARGPQRELRFGNSPLMLGIWLLLRAPVVFGIGAGIVYGFGLDGPIPAWAIPLIQLGLAALLTAVYAGLVLRRAIKVQAGTRGRARLIVLASAELVSVIPLVIVAGVLSHAFTDTGALTFGLGAREVLPLGWRGLVESLRMTLSTQGTLLLGALALAALAVVGVVELVTLIASWFLLRRRTRSAIWGVVDLVLLAAFVAVTLLLPIQPTSPDALTLPVIRLTVTTLFAIRFLWRVLPYVLDLVEKTGFRLLVASRMLRAKKSGFLTAIGALSIMAVAFSSCTLTTTLSVMGGFRNDLKRKILGNNAHVVIDREHGTFEGWQPMLETVRANDEVIGATPYVQGEVMITSATNLSGAVLRGIDPATIGNVTELPRNMRHGRLEYLTHPERLLRLRPEEMGRNLLAPSIRVDPDEPLPPPIPGAGLLDDAKDVIEETGALERRRVEQEIEEFLLPVPEAGPRADPSDEREVLPGLIVGQELARALRLNLGDTVDVVSPFGDLGPTGPIPKTRPFRIAGIFYSGMYEFDMKMAYTTVEDAQRFLDVGDAVHGIEVKVKDGERAERVAQALTSAIDQPTLRVRAWQEVNRNLFGALQLEKLAMFIVLGLAILVASFCVVASLTLMVQEKGKEVGIFKAMGASSEQIVAVFMAQGLMIGLLGAAIGLGLGYLVCFAAEHFGISISAEVYYIDKLPVHIDGVEFALVGVAAVVICLLATIYPALLGSRLRPVDALRYT